jgi:uncharacterized phiE125 gp8 family phage protein
MAQYYELTTAGDLPVSLSDFKTGAKITHDAEDDYILALIEASTQVIEIALHGRQARANSYYLFVDGFADRIVLNKDPVTGTPVIEYLVSGTFTALSDPTIWYLKTTKQFSEIILKDGEVWPTIAAVDDLEHNVRVTFSTAAHEYAHVIKAAIQRHVLYMYENRGDSDLVSATNSLEASGAHGVFSSVAIKLV